MELRQALEPWLRHFGRKKWKEYRRDDKMEQVRKTGILWIKWDTYVEDEFEALELLALYSKVDYDEWLRVLTELCPEKMKYWEANEMNGSPLRLGCYVHSNKLTSKICERFLLGDVDYSASVSYRRTRRLFESTIRAKGAAAEDKLVVPVRLRSRHYDMASGGEDPEQSIWRDALLLASTQAAMGSAIAGVGGYTPRWPSLFRIVEADFGTRAWSLQDLLYARQIAASGVAVQPLVVPSFNLTMKVAPLYTTTLHLLLAVNGLNCNFAASKAVVLDEELSAQTIDGVFSAVLASRSVEEIRISQRFRDEMDNRRLWQWIATVVFSKEASGIVKRLTISSSDQLTMAQVDDINQVVNAQDPVSVLFASTQSQVFGNISEFLLSPPRTTEGEVRVQQLSMMKLDERMRHVRVLEIPDGEDDFCSVLLPGWGRAWARRGDILMESTGEGQNGAALLMDGSVELTIESFESSHEPVLLAFLHVTGRRLKKLKILQVRHGHLDQNPLFTADGLRQLFHACPHLEELDVPAIPPSLLQVITECYEEGVCRVKHLATKESSVEGQQAFAIRFFECLADPDHPMSQLLTILRMESSLQDDLYAVLTAMLKANRTLREVRLFLRRSYASRVIPPELTAYDGEPIRAGPLAIKKKIAFLSVVQAKPNQLDTSELPPVRAVQSLNSDIIVRIFEFAAKCRKRIVTFG